MSAESLHSESQALRVEHSTLQRIQINALEHFAKYGYLGASVREITAAAQVTKPTLYYYFKNKEELYRGLAANSFELLLSTVRSSLHQGLNFCDRFCAAVEAYHKFCDLNFPTARFICTIANSPSRDVPDVGLAMFKENLSQEIEKIVDEAVAQSELGSDRQLCVRLILQGLFSLCMERKLAGQPIDLGDLHRTVQELIKS